MTFLFLYVVVSIVVAAVWIIAFFEAYIAQDKDDARERLMKALKAPLWPITGLLLVYSALKWALSK